MKSKEKVGVKAEVGTWCQLLFSWGGREKEKGSALKWENARRPGVLQQPCFVGNQWRWDSISTPIVYFLLKHQNKTFLLAWGTLINLRMSKGIVYSNKASGHYLFTFSPERATERGCRRGDSYWCLKFEK